MTFTVGEATLLFVELPMVIALVVVIIIMSRKDKQMNYRELYEADKDIKEYVDKYAASNEITVAVALTHKMVHEYINYSIRFKKAGKNA